jgi:hypothetical protein
MLIAFLVLLYLVNGVLAFGMTMANFQQKFPTVRSNSDYSVATFLSLIPGSAVIIFFLSGFAKYGLQFRAIPAITGAAADSYYRKKYGY